MSQVRDRLIELIDTRAFDPVLEKSPEDYQSPGAREKLRDLQSTTRSTQQRYHKHETAAGVRDEFKNDLSSDAAKRVHQELESLGLPTLPEIEHEFDRAYSSTGEG